MVQYYPEFFNDVFGPIMQPGSSSHTAGPCRVGYLANQLLGEKPVKIVVSLDKFGSFAGTFGHMSEDLGMLAGAYGLLPEDERIFDIKSILEDEGTEYEFQFVDFPESSHPNAVQFTLTSATGKVATLLGNSTGGGMVEVVTINGVNYSYLGDCYLTCVFSDSEKLDLPEGVLSSTCVQVDGGFNHYITYCEPLESPLTGTQFTLKPILPVKCTLERKPQLFDTFAKWISLAKAQGKTLSEVAIDYEQGASSWTREEIVEYMKKVRCTMEQQTQSVYSSSEGVLETPFSGFHYKKWEQYERTGEPLSLGVISSAVHYAFGVQALKRGVPLVPGPMGTGGGFLYSALRSVKEARDYSNDSVVDALFVAAGVGAICYTRTNPTGEELGCTGECGVCSAMASAAITHLCGGTPE